MDIAQYELINPRAVLDLSTGVQLIYRTPNRETLARANTIFSKEPDTINWISGFDRSDIFVDIGANMGLYSIFAAKVTGCTVFAFEPEALNVAVLNGNIRENRLEDRVIAFPIALSNEVKVSRLFVDQNYPGGSGNSFDLAVDAQLRPYAHKFAQGCVAFPLDKLVQDQVLPPPTQIKVDVDGLEHLVVAGMQEQISGTALRGILVEINTNLAEHRSIVDALKAAGFGFSEVEADKARRKHGPFQGTGNVIFTR